MSFEDETIAGTSALRADGIVSSELTNCRICRDGRAIRLNLLNHDGNPTYVEFTLEQAAAVVMTLPRLLTAALQSSSGRSDLRFVLPVDKWSLEIAHSQSVLIFTLQTEDGFDASFGLSPKMCKDIASALSKDLAATVENIGLTARFQ